MEEVEEEENKDEAQVRRFKNSIADLFNLNEKEGDNNCMFLTLFRTSFESPDYHAEARYQVVGFTTANSQRFSTSQNDFGGNLVLLLDYQARCGQQNFMHSQSYMVLTLKCTIEWLSLILYIILHRDSTLSRQSGCFIQVITMILLFQYMQVKLYRFVEGSIKDEEKWFYEEGGI